MEITITAKLRIYPTTQQAKLLSETAFAYREGCNDVSSVIFNTKTLKTKDLHQLTYRFLRENIGLRSQMAQSVRKTVIARYKSLIGNGHDWKLIVFKKPEYDMVWKRDYSLKNNHFSINTLQGRIDVLFESNGMEHFFKETWSFGTAKLLYKHNKWYLYIPMTKEIDEVHGKNINQIVGIDLGINFLAVTYDSFGKTTFYNGKAIKHKRQKYKRLRKELQRKGTASARKRLIAIGEREKRWMSDVNHCVSKAIIKMYGENTMFVLEDLKGVRKVTEKVHRHSRYLMVSWAFYQLYQYIKYKSSMNNSETIVVDPRYTSQKCPKCNYIEKTNRDKAHHFFTCKKCGYKSNDDRIAAMNLHIKGIEYIDKQ